MFFTFCNNSGSFKSWNSTPLNQKNVFISPRTESNVSKLFYGRNYLTHWRGSEAAGQVNEIRPELQEAFHRKEERNF